MTTPTPDAPDWAAGSQAVAVPTLIGQYTVLPSNSSGYIDISAYESVTITPGSGFGVVGTVVQYNKDKSGVYQGVGSGIPLTSQAVTFDVVGQYLLLYNTSASLTRVWNVFGNPRSGRLRSGVMAGWQPAPYVGSIASQSWVAGTEVTATGSNNTGIPQGPCWCTVSFSLSTFKGYVYTLGTIGERSTLVDSVDCSVDSTGALSKRIMVATPADVAFIGVHSTASQTSGATITLTPAY